MVPSTLVVVALEVVDHPLTYQRVMMVAQGSLEVASLLQEAEEAYPAAVLEEEEEASMEWVRRQGLVMMVEHRQTAGEVDRRETVDSGRPTNALQPNHAFRLLNPF